MLNRLKALRPIAAVAFASLSRSGCPPRLRPMTHYGSARRWRKRSRSCRSMSASKRASSRKMVSTCNRRPLPATPSCNRRWRPTDRRRARLRSRHGVHRQGFAGEGDRRHGRTAALLAIVVRPDGPKTAADLKGKKISVSTAGSLTAWLVSQTSRRQGWGSQGIDIAPMGAMPSQIAALKRGDIDGIVMDIGNAFDLESKGEGRILMRFTDIRISSFTSSTPPTKPSPAGPTICAISSKAGSRRCLHAHAQGRPSKSQGPSPARMRTSPAAPMTN